MAAISQPRATSRAVRAELLACTAIAHLPQSGVVLARVTVLE